MTWIFLVMLGLIVASIVIEMILPQGLKDRMGAALCWGMMAVTMTFLGMATLGLIWSTWTIYLQPALMG